MKGIEMKDRMQNVHMIDTSLRTPALRQSTQTANFLKPLLSSFDKVYSWQIQSGFVPPDPPNKDIVSRMPAVCSSVSPSKSLATERKITF